ncbi:AAA family ATPase [Exiguobacterium acetylicum]|uniref:AAA family ATPase n=1 Tax=Exiguobacterium acetylicum TaxID=41170 RepID=UPI0035A5E194
MIIKELILNNFRQYYGQQSISFAYGETDNVTVIHGENGSGKTALINAFLWVLYGKPLNLPNSHEVINRRFVRESSLTGVAEITTSVKLYFEDGNHQFEIERFLNHKFDGTTYLPSKKTEVLLKRINESGEGEIIKSVSDTIDKIIPQKLSSFFFFDGERIDNLGKQRAKNEIKESIKLMMGLDLFVAAKKHLQSAKKNFQEELAKKNGGEYEALIINRNELNDEKEKLINRLSDARSNIVALQEEIKVVDEKLQADAEIGALQIEYDSKKKELERLQKALVSIENELAKLLSSNGHLVMSLSLIQQIENKSENDDRLESYVDKEFLKKLEKEEFCICGRPISEHEKEHIAHLRTSSAYSQHNGIQVLNKKMNGIKEKRKNIFEQVRVYSNQRNQQLKDIVTVQQEIAELNVNKGSKNNPELIDLQKKFTQLEHSIQEQRAMIMYYEKQREELNMKADLFEKQIAKKERENLKELNLQNSLNTSMKFEKVISRLLEFQEDDVRKRLAFQIKEVFSKFLRKNYNVTMTSDYELIVTDNSHEEVGMSQGEGQLTSLAFIGAIVDMQRKKAEKPNSDFQIKGANMKAVYPLVMDSPFGALDADHRKRVAEGIHQLSDQVIVIVSTSQWDGEVENQLSKHAGKEYTLHYIENDALEFTQIVEGRI